MYGSTEVKAGAEIKPLVTYVVTEPGDQKAFNCLAAREVCKLLSYVKCAN